MTTTRPSRSRAHAPKLPEHLRSDRSAAAAPLASLTSWTCFASLCIVIVAHAFGLLGAVAYSVVVFSGVVCGIYGLRRQRPSLRWPWWSLVVAGILWTVGGAVGDATQATGDLSPERSLLPDVFALPGYALFGAAIYGLLRSRRVRGSNGGELLDGIMLGAGALLIVNEVIIVPTLDNGNTWMMARLAVSIYPAISMCLLVLAARLAFTPGEHSPAFWLLLIGTTNLLVGDVIFALGEIGTFRADQTLLEVPFLLVPTCIGAAILHPSIRSVARPTLHRRRSVGYGRLLAVAGALLAPIVVIATRDTSRGTPATTVLCLVLAVTAIVRLTSATKEQGALEARLMHQASHDDLTGLPSRTLILDQLDLMLQTNANGGPVAVMFIDLDQFKLINDSMGHSVGDQLLVLASKRIQSCLRPHDVVGRISGDEFIVLAPSDAPAAIQLGERIRKVLSDSFSLDAGEVFVSVSVGITVALPGTRVPASTLVQEADTAMYRSKESGRNRVTMFDASMRERVARRVELERSLRHALAVGQISASFQPIVSLPSGRVQGFEALARWSNDGQMVSPAEFIPVAEDSGLIVPLGAFMLDEACRNLAMWRRTIDGATQLHISVNLSARQIRESDIVDTVAETLERHSLPGAALWLEITESVMMEDSVITASVLAGLRTLGVRLSVDDFGTGFSSLSYLKRFPVSCVKIDRSFVLGLGQHESDSSLIGAIIALGAALDLDSVAEGVETADQAARLLALGCRQAQGHLFAEAVPAAQVPAMLERLGLNGVARRHAQRRCATPARRV